MFVILYDAAVILLLVRLGAVPAITLEPVAWTALAALASAFTVLEMRRDRRDRNRPYVVADFEVEQVQILHFRLRNLGAGPAFDVRLEFQPPPIDTLGRRLDELPIFQHPLPALFPGDQVRTFFHMAHELHSSNLPKAFTITVHCRGEGGTHRSDVFRVDLQQHLGLLYGEEHTVEESLKRIADELKDVVSLARRISSSHALIVESRADQEARVRQRRDEIEEIRRRATEAATGEQEETGGDTSRGTVAEDLPTREASGLQTAEPGTD